MKNSLLILLTLISLTVCAQENPRNIGLLEPQLAITLPVSRADIPETERKEKIDPETHLLLAVDREYIVEGGWELVEAAYVNGGGELVSAQLDTHNWYNATVPGTVLTTLVEQGIYPDPLYGLNNMVIPDTLCRMDWWYRTEFPLPASKSDEKVFLLLNGINYAAEVWLNGKALGSLKGAFIRGEYDITDKLADKNYLAIFIQPPPHPGIPHEASALNPKGPNGGSMCQDGPTFISSEGWDWVPGIRDRNIGVWQDVRLKIAGQARMVDLQVITDLPLPDTSEAGITLRTTIECDLEGVYTLDMEVEGKQVKEKLKLKKGSNEILLTPAENRHLKLKNPKLWWPNGYGGQNLYTMQLLLRDADSKIVDQETIRFGIRELSYEFAIADEKNEFQRIQFDPIRDFGSQPRALFDHLNRIPFKEGVELPTLHEGISSEMFEKLEGDNPYLVIKVNGRSIFCKGGNWGMDDAMKRVSRERLEPYFKLHKEAHYTMIRNWTGESTEEVFYELADEYGLLVWNDFWMSTEGYNMPPADEKLFMSNATDVVKRFRNHPSIALWCSRNEGYAPAGLDRPLADLVALKDGTRMYQSNSRYLNLQPSGPWHYFDDINFYFEQNADGFSTEVGTQSFPTAESMEAMMTEADLWPVSDAWYYHDLHTGHQEYRAALIDNYAEALNLEEFSKRAQLLNYVSHRAIFEAWNSKLWEDASGILLWMTHPAWPSMIWQTYSSDYETHGAYFGAKKGCEPLHIQMNNHDRQVVVVNTTLQAYENLEVQASVMDEKGKVLFSRKSSAHVAPNAKTECFTLEIPDDLELPEVWFTKLLLSDGAGNLLSDNFYWDSRNRENRFFSFNTLEKTVLSAKGEHGLEKGILSGTVKIRNESKTVTLAVKLNLRKRDTGERILPVYFSDGYFSLMPGEEKVVQFNCHWNKDLEELELTAEGYNLDRQVVLRLE